ncbi:MAG: DUF721 domain-containing protein [Gammaproteobacteria bacterium]|nr:DUF721 domain-containing protein [Gammaproteobacteria bacterium]MDH5692419.1 DUF721 domain-containing protein [Gammaproteobacteria bacterium]
MLSRSSSHLGHLLAVAEQIKTLNRLVMEVLPPESQAHCAVIPITGQKLTLLVNSPVWASKLRMMQSTLLKTLQQKPELANVKTLAIRHSAKAFIPIGKAK